MFFIEEFDKGKIYTNSETMVAKSQNRIIAKTQNLRRKTNCAVTKTISDAKNRIFNRVCSNFNSRPQVLAQ
jgi:hypothetical protein